MKRLCFLSIISIVASSIVCSQPLQNQQLYKFYQTISAINSLYVDTVNQEKLVETAIEGVLEKLDPHSIYIPADEVNRANETIEGNFEGIGIQFQMLNDTLFVSQTISGCPAQKVGILPCDRIVSVDGKNIAGVNIKNSEIMKLLRGPRGTTVLVNVVRNGEKNPIEFTITRDKIPIYSVDAAYMIAPKIGYIKINSFSATTFDEFKKAFKKLKSQKMERLILDLQGNGGGLLQTAIDLTNQFLPEGKLIVYTQGEHQKRTTALSSGHGLFENGKMVVLIDEYSASASEILSGALQDWDRALVVGRRSFGKGLVQRPVPLNDGSIIRLTTARYYTPCGRNIQKPYNKTVENYKNDLIERYNRGELQHSDSIHFPDSLKYSTLRLERTVYGGGGIMPDVFVPLDTTQFTTFHRSILAKGIINNSVAKFVENNREKLTKKYQKFDDFAQNFEFNDNFIDELRQKAAEKEITCTDSVFEQSKPLILLQTKALVAQDVFDKTAFYRIINTNDAIIKKAIEILENEDNDFFRQ